MPQDPSKLALPFLTRDMLAFEHGVKFSLRITTQSVSAQTMFVRGLTREGRFIFNHVMSSNSLPTSSTFRIPDFPIMVSASLAIEGFDQGEAWVRLALVIDDDVIYELASGLVYSNKAVAWPSSLVSDQRPGGGGLTTFSGTNQVAGTEINDTVPDGQTWRLLGIRFQLQTSGVANDRRVHIVLQFLSGNNIDCIASAVQAASTTRNYSCAPWGVLPTASDDNDILIPLPINTILPEISRIITETTNFDGTGTGDNFGTPSYIIERYFQPT